MAGDRQLQIHQRLDMGAVEVEDALTEIEQAEGGHHADNAEHRGGPQHHPHVPGLGLVLVVNVVIGNGQDGAVVEQRQHHDHHRRQRIEVEDQDRQRHEEQHADRLGDAVDRVAVHALEDAAALLDGVDDHREPRCQQHDRGSRTRRVRRAGYGDAAIGLLQRRGVIDAVPGHADDVAALLQNVDDVEFVLRKHLRESIGMLDGLGKLRGLLMLGVAKTAGVENIRAQAQFPGGFPGDGQRIARHHLDGHPHVSSGRDGRLGLLPGRVEQRQDTQKLPWPIGLGARHTQSAKAPRRELVDRLVDRLLDLGGIGRQFQDHLRRPFGDLEFLAVRARDGGFRAFVDGIERLEMGYLIRLQGMVVLQGAEHGEVDGVLVVRPRRQRRAQNELSCRDVVQAERIAQRQLVLGQRAGLVGAQHVDAGQFLDGRQPRHDRLPAGEQPRADRHGHG